MKPDIDSAVRAGDIFAVLIEYYYEVKNYSTCNDLLKKMQERKIIATPYIDSSIVQPSLPLDSRCLCCSGHQDRQTSKEATATRG
jgi:hypothetical protein